MFKNGTQPCSRPSPPCFVERRRKPASASPTITPSPSSPSSCATAPPSLARAKTALALTIAQGNAESRRLDELDARIADLELRVRAALSRKQDDLARTGATAIAALEEERAAAKKGAVALEHEVATLRAAVANFETRLIDLERGRKLATVERRLRDARIGAADGDIVRSGLKEAEATLEKIRSRHALERDSTAVLLTLEPSSANAVAERLAAAGCGPKLRIDADDVLRRLRRRIARS